jgi:hypothetical protein
VAGRLNRWVSGNIESNSGCCRELLIMAIALLNLGDFYVCRRGGRTDPWTEGIIISSNGGSAGRCSVTWGLMDSLNLRNGARTSDLTVRVRQEKAFYGVIDMDEEPPSLLDHAIVVGLGHIGSVDTK